MLFSVGLLESIVREEMKAHFQTHHAFLHPQLSALLHLGQLLRIKEVLFSLHVELHTFKAQCWLVAWVRMTVFPFGQSIVDSVQKEKKP